MAYLRSMLGALTIIDAVSRLVPGVLGEPKALVLPVIVLFAVAQRRFVEGVAATGVKG